MSTLLASIILNGQPGSASAIVIPGDSPTTVSKQELVDAVLDAQKALAELGLGRGLIASAGLANSYELAVLFLAIVSQRAIAAPLNPAFKQPEFEFFLDDLRPSVVFVPAGAVEKNEPVFQAAQKVGVPAIEVSRAGSKISLKPHSRPKLGQARTELAQADDVALVLHTSGTTGRPKSVPLSHRNICKSMDNIERTYRLNHRDRSLLVMPLFHIHGLVAGLLAPLGSGGSVIVPPRFSAGSFWSDFVAHGANWYTAVPTIHQILLEHPFPSPAPKIRFIRSCSSPLPPAVFDQLEKKFGAPVLEAYAMTEGAHQIASNPLPPARRQAGSVGIPQGVEVRILKPFSGDDPSQMDETPLPIGTEGEICIRGANVTAGYVNNPVANASSFTPTDRFFRTGDNGKLDEHGYIIITGRLKEMINRGGEKISPVEVDSVVTQHPDVAEATSFAVPDKLYGQTVGIAVVRRAGSDLSASALREWLRPRLASFKVPEKVYFTKLMPKTATGKIQRQQVAKAMAGKTAEQSAADGDALEPERAEKAKAKL